tara:strand:- start:531 stop:2189 length:1659 start_codon:yes stop_codon:yes gene_type:complete
MKIIEQNLIDDDITFISHEPCPNCGSKDNLARYSDGHGYCFGCNRYEKADDMELTQTTSQDFGIEHLLKPKNKEEYTFAQGDIKGLVKRSIAKDTCQKFDYRVATHMGQPCQVANYKVNNKIVAQKLRFSNKTFQWIGDTSQAGLFGQHLWRDGGKMVVVTEGELDCMSVSQVQGNKWACVSIKNGSQGAKKDIQKSLEWLDKFETVVFMFDMDDAGQKAAIECASVLKPGKAKIAYLPMKDASDMLSSSKIKELIDSVWSAKTFRPDGIISGEDLWVAVSQEEVVVSVDYPFVGLNEKTHGLRKSELTTITAGSGIGKSALVREIGYHLIKKGEKVGFLMLEETVKRTALGIMGLHLNKPLHLGKVSVEESELSNAFNDTIGNGRVYFYDSFGSTSIDNLLNRVRFLSQGAECDWIILDHLSIVVSGLGDGDERRLIDNAMTMLRTLVQETGIGLILVSHLKRPSGDKGHEEGATTSLSQLRGSHAIAQLSDMVISLERNQQGDDANTTTVRVLKNRFSGETGIACHCLYNPETGRMLETTLEFSNQQDEF